MRRKLIRLNPLSVLIGRVIQRERNIMGLTSDEVAHELGLGPSFWRLIESGVNNPHPNKAFGITKIFSRFEYIPLCVLLTTLSLSKTYREDEESIRELLFPSHDFLLLFIFRLGSPYQPSLSLSIKNSPSH